jgi:hypothetical protein
MITISCKFINVRKKRQKKGKDEKRTVEGFAGNDEIIGLTPWSLLN